VQESSDDRVRAGEVRFIPLSVGETIRPEDGSGRTAGSFFADLIDDRGIELNDKDILVLSSKVVGILEGARPPFPEGTDPRPGIPQGPA